MFREQYNMLNQQVIPDETLLNDTILEAEKIQRKSHHKVPSFSKAVIVFAAICLCLFCSMPVLAASVESIYELMYLVSPSMAQYFMPVQRADEDHGIRMEVISAYIHGNTAKVYVTMQDLTSDRIDETTDLFDSYSINRPFDSLAYCERVGYDDSTKTATFLITLTEWGNNDITGDKITFTVKEFLSRKKTYEGILIPLPMSSVDIAANTQRVSDLTGWSGTGIADFDEENVAALIPAAPIIEFLVEGIEMTGAGYIDGKLHIQIAATRNNENDNHGYVYLKDSNGSRIDYTYSFNFTQQHEQAKRIDYCNYVFDIPQSEIAKYTLYGDFVTSGMITKGNWTVTFPLEQ